MTTKLTKKQKSKTQSRKRVKGGVVPMVGGTNFGEASFNDPTFGGAYYGLNTYQNDLFGATESSTQSGGSASATKSKRQNSVKKTDIKNFIINTYLHLKDKFKRKPNDVLYKITRSDNGDDLIQIIKNNEVVFEEKFT